ncbi:hypothetical protein DL766_008346 [Monosporascus sp. MC13-8B]|uniref:Uncharacterized protein n=1 Tax=Monosporascus cannonballus TaxID=155416 RepID=A0ABY0H193_9PEZI|nr:hypothetical protein DL762_006849 [Monosporascus cannonballus]RYP19818.1 hypothetical protein DL766_008346 [Monosporascus sp. MC13-8B]
MLFSVCIAAASLLVAAHSAAIAAGVPRQDAAAALAFEIRRAYSVKPAERPPSYQYCGISFDVTDPLSNTTTQCKGEHGPCAKSNEEPAKPKRPLDAGHPAACADSRFSFWLDSFRGIEDYSLAVRFVEGGSGSGSSSEEPQDYRVGQVRVGVTPRINRENFPDSWRYQCGGSNHCTGIVDRVEAPFVEE